MPKDPELKKCSEWCGMYRQFTALFSMGKDAIRAYNTAIHARKFNEDGDLWYNYIELPKNSRQYRDDMEFSKLWNDWSWNSSDMVRRGENAI